MPIVLLAYFLTILVDFEAQNEPKMPKKDLIMCLKRLALGLLMLSSSLLILARMKRLLVMKRYSLKSDISGDEKVIDYKSDYSDEIYHRKNGETEDFRLDFYFGHYGKLTSL